MCACLLSKKVHSNASSSDAKKEVVMASHRVVSLPYKNQVEFSLKPKKIGFKPVCSMPNLFAIGLFPVINWSGYVCKDTQFSGLQHTDEWTEPACTVLSKLEHGHEMIDEPTNHSGGTHPPCQAIWCQPALPLDTAPRTVFIVPFLLLIASFGL